MGIKLSLTSILESIEMNSTENLFNSFYWAGRCRCMRYSKDEFYRGFIGEEGYVEYCYHVSAAEALLKQRPLDERVAVYRKLKEEQRKIMNREGIYSSISEEEWLGQKEDVEMSLSEFERKFLD